MRGFTALMPLVVVGLIAFPGRVSSVPEQPSFGDYCKLTLQAESRNRHVYGTVTAECNSCAWYNHTGPFGNWDVSSWFGAAADEFQYMGWTNHDRICNRWEDTPEWNSCTTDYPSPDERVYNEPEGVFTSQLSPAVGSLGIATDWFQTSEDEGCLILNGAQYSAGTTMSLYELDYPDGNEHITDTIFGDTVTLSCDRDGCAPIVSPWSNNWSNPVTSAEFRFKVIGSCHHKEGKGC